MKKRILSILLFVVILIFIAFGGKWLTGYIARVSQEPVSIIIASDIHYLAKEYTGNYFKAPFAGSDGKMTHYSGFYTDAFFSEVIKQKPNVLILSGDLTLNGSVKSHEEFISKLRVIEENGIDVLVIPGNHDVNTSSGDYSSAPPELVDSLFSSGFSSMYEDFGPSKALSRDSNSFSYIYEASPTLRILMLDTNLDRKCWVNEDTLVWIEEQLKSAKTDGVDVIAVSHQNLQIHNERLYFSYQLYNADKLLALYEAYDVKLNLSGHIHVQSIVTGPSVPEVAVGSLAVCGTQYGKLTYTGTTLEYTTHKTDVVSYAKETGITEESLLTFSDHSTWFFEEVSRLSVYEKFAESGLSEQDITLLAETYAKINSAYFMGNPINQEELSDGLSLWESYKDGFIYNYIQTMLNESQRNNQTLTISCY